MSLVLAGCTPSTPPSVPTPTPSPNPGWDDHGPIVYARGRDTSGTVQQDIVAWNSAHPDEPVTLHELPASAEKQRDRIIENGRAESGEFTVLAVDVAWVTEFAANGWLQALPADLFPTAGVLPGAVDASTHAGVLYTAPATVDVGMLYVRQDLLAEAGLEPPATWADLQAACDRILPDHRGLSCYAGQHRTDEGLTANVVEAVTSAGGEVVTAAGVPAVNTPPAIAGLQWMTDGFTTGMIPADALTWKEADGLAAFLAGEVLFHRNWSHVWNLVDAADASREGGRRFGVATLPGKDGPGVAVLGGQGLGVSTSAQNLGTARDFITWMASRENQQRRLDAGSLAPVLEEFYAEGGAGSAFLETVRDSLASARPAPRVVRYDDVTAAIQDAADAALRGTKDPADAFEELQATLEGLVS